MQPIAHLGALVFGSDIDGRQMRGKRSGMCFILSFWYTHMSLQICSSDKTPGVIRAAKQYGLASHVVDLATFDIAHNPWRCGELFDAIVTDPPCESSKRFFPTKYRFSEPVV